MRTHFITQREKQILDLVARGYTNKEIARELHIKPATVTSHMGRILRVLGAKSRSHAIFLVYCARP